MADQAARFDQRELRNAFGMFATGVAVITAKNPLSQTIGVTMSSFNSVSLDPPLVLFSVDRRGRSLDGMLKAKGYAVNILARSQEHLSNLFAKQLSDKFAQVEHDLGYEEAPLLRGAIAHFECKPYAHYDGGDHVIFVGEVMHFSTQDEGEPLLFFRGKYQNLKKAEERQAPTEWPLPSHYG